MRDITEFFVNSTENAGNRKHSALCFVFNVTFCYISRAVRLNCVHHQPVYISMLIDTKVSVIWTHFHATVNRGPWLSSLLWIASCHTCILPARSVMLIFIWRFPCDTFTLYRAAAEDRTFQMLRHVLNRTLLATNNAVFLSFLKTSSISVATVSAVAESSYQI